MWARAGDVPGLYLAFAGIGLAGAAVLYEPAFATVNAYFDAQRRKALLTVTMVAGLASTIFLPGSALLISRLGWRQALLILAAVQAATAVPHVLLLRRRPADHGWQRGGVRDPSGSTAGPAARRAPAMVSSAPTERRQLSATLRSGPVALATIGAVLGSAVIAAVAVLFLAYLRQGGYTLAVASAAAGALGLVQIAGRAVLTVLARRMSTAVAAAVMLAAQTARVTVLLLVRGLAGVVIFVVLFGLGFGVLNIARPDMLAQYAPRRLYARLSGIQASLVITAEAAAPLPPPSCTRPAGAIRRCSLPLPSARSARRCCSRPQIAPTARHGLRAVPATPHFPASDVRFSTAPHRLRGVDGCAVADLRRPAADPQPRQPCWAKAPVGGRSCDAEPLGDTRPAAI